MFSLESIHWSSQTIPYVGSKSYVFFLRHWAEPPAGGWVIPLKLSPERRKLGEVQQVAEQVFRFLNSAEDFQVGASGPRGQGASAGQGGQVAYHEIGPMMQEVAWIYHVQHRKMMVNHETAGYPVTQSFGRPV
jgi:hypothetical protein